MPLNPDIDVEASRRAASARALKMAHWCWTLEDSGSRPSYEAWEAFSQVCPLADLCGAWRSCMWAHERMWRVALAHNACVSIEYPRIARTL